MNVALRRVNDVPVTAPPLSDLHAMLGRIERVYDAHWLNRVANDPDVIDEIKGYLIPPLNLSGLAANPANICLTGEQGAILFTPLQPGIFECHSMCLANGRGRWMLDFTRACLHWMFTRTPAVELLTKVPRGNLKARALAKAIGGTKEFTARNGWVRNLDPVDADVFGLTLQHWARTAPGLTERGSWFHDRLETEFARHGASDQIHDEDEDHHRAVGLACEMIMGGQPDKAMIFYARVARMAGYGPITIVNPYPLTIDIGNAILVIRDDDFWMATVKGG